MVDRVDVRLENGHIGPVQIWEVGEGADAVKLVLASDVRAPVADGVTWPSAFIPNRLFFKHVMLPSKSGQAMLQKAVYRVIHRSLPATIKEDSAAKAREAANRKAGNLPPWLEGAPAPDRNVYEQKSAWLGAVVEYDESNPQNRGLAWWEKYGNAPEPVNSTIVLGDTPIAGGGARAFVPSAEIGGVEAIAPLEAARIIAQAATAARAKAVSEGPFKKATNVSIDFGKRCVLTLAAPRKAVPARAATRYLPPQPGSRTASPATLRRIATTRRRRLIAAR